VKKFNEIGWKNSRLFILTNKRFINTDGKSAKSDLAFKDINVAFFDPQLMKIIILNNPKVKDTKKYYFELLEKYD